MRKKEASRWQERLDLTRRFTAQYEGLTRRSGSLQEWIELKFSCSRQEAAELILAVKEQDKRRAEVEPTARDTAAWELRNGLGEIIASRGTGEVVDRVIVLSALYPKLPLGRIEVIEALLAQMDRLEEGS